MLRNVGFGQLLLIVLTIILVTGPRRSLEFTRKVRRIPTRVGDKAREVTRGVTGPRRALHIGRGLGRLSRSGWDLLRELTSAGEAEIPAVESAGEEGDSPRQVAGG